MIFSLRMWFITKLIDNRNLLKNLVVRDIKHRYVGSMGGFLWSVLHPLALLISYTFVFSVVLRLRVPVEGTESFPLFLFCGMVPWILFSETVMRSCTAITDNAPLITKTVIPAEILPVAITLSNLVNHAVSLLILLGILMAFQTVPLSAIGILLYLPLLLLFSQGVGWLVAGLQVFLRDTIQVLQIVIQLWFWFTPIFYSADGVPENFRFLMALNPMSTIVTGYRNSLLNLAQPSPIEIAGVAAISVGVFVIGGLIFRQTKPVFADVL